MPGSRIVSDEVHGGAGLSLPLSRSDAMMEGTESVSVLPPAFRNRLYGLFNQIEQEFEALYAENLQRKLPINSSLTYIVHCLTFYSFNIVQEKVELGIGPSRLDRDSFGAADHRPSLDQTDFDSFFTKHLLKQKCMALTF